MMNNDIDPEAKVCYNCKYMIWAVGIGMGIRCGNVNNKTSTGVTPLVPSRMYSCSYFEHYENYDKDEPREDKTI